MKFNQELHLLKNKAENDQLKQELKTEVTEKVSSVDLFITLFWAFILNRMLFNLCGSSFSNKLLSLLSGKPSDGTD